MHITHVNLARGFRGGERQTLNLMEGLQRLGITQTLICRNGEELELRARELNLHAIGIRHPLCGHLSAPARDLVHVHEARGAYWAAMERALRKTPYIITRRVPVPLSRSLITSAVYGNAAALFGVSQDVSRRLATQTHRNVRTILSCPSHFRHTVAETEAIRHQLGDGPVIGHVGVLNDNHKGQSVLIHAFLQLAASYPNARLLLVGRGPDRERLERQSEGDRRIVFAGQQADPGPWIAAMDVFAFPSREEGLGSSVLDAMYAGVPVVASTAGGLPELIGADERGVAVDSFEPNAWARAIRRLLTDASLRSRIVDAARRFAGQNDAESMTRQYAACYRKLLSRGNKDFSWLDTELNAPL